MVVGDYVQTVRRIHSGWVLPRGTRGTVCGIDESNPEWVKVEKADGSVFYAHADWLTRLLTASEIERNT